MIPAAEKTGVVAENDGVTSQYPYQCADTESGIGHADGVQCALALRLAAVKQRRPGGAIRTTMAVAISIQAVSVLSI